MENAIPTYGYGVNLEGVAFDEAVQRATEALQSEGFGVITTIDVRDTLKKKLDVDFRPYVILGACNPPLAHRALAAEPGVGLLLPCNVVVSEEPGGARVQAIKPAAMFEVVKNASLEPLVGEVDARLRRVMDRLGGPHA